MPDVKMTGRNPCVSGNRHGFYYGFVYLTLNHYPKTWGHLVYSLCIVRLWLTQGSCKQGVTGEWPGCYSALVKVPSAGEEPWHRPTDLFKASPWSKLHSYVMTARLQWRVSGTPPLGLGVSMSGIWVCGDPVSLCLQGRRNGIAC